MTGHVAAEWADYAEHVLDPDAPSIQVQETRRAFYAGAYGILTRIARLLSDDQRVAPEDLRLMGEIYGELLEFSRDVARGKR